MSETEAIVQMKYNEAIKYLRDCGFNRAQSREILKEARDPSPFINPEELAVFYDEKSKYYAIAIAERKDLDDEFEHVCTDECNHEYDDPHLVNRMFHLFSKYGESYDFTTTCALLGISRERGLKLKRKYGLRKDSMPFSPDYMLDYTDNELLNSISANRENSIRRRIQMRNIRNLESRIRDAEINKAFIDARLQNIQPIEIEKKEFSNRIQGPLTAFVATHDLHFGKVGEYSETYWHDLLRSILESLANSTASKIVLTFGSDAFNVDNTLFTTTKGTRQESSKLLGEIADEYISWFISLVRYCAILVDDVSVYVIQGNHDRSLSVVAGTMLKHIFDDKIFIEDTENIRKYHACGSTLVMMHHGDIKTKNSAATGYSEAANIWPDRGFNRQIIMQGHLHGFALKTDHGVQYTTSTSAGSRSKWEQDHFGDHDDQRMTIYYVPDDDFISRIDFVRPESVVTDDVLEVF